MKFKNFSEAAPWLAAELENFGWQKHLKPLTAAMLPMVQLFEPPPDPKAEKSRTGGLMTLRTITRKKIKKYPVGISKLGGLPDLPPSIPWPVNDIGQELNFVGQLDCSTLPAVPGRPLPAKGWISFFVEKSDRRFPLPCRVFHHKGPGLRSRKPKLPTSIAGDGKILQPIRIGQASLSLSLPEPNGEGWRSLKNLRLDIDDYLDLKEPYADCVATLFGHARTEHNVSASQVVNRLSKDKAKDWITFLKVRIVCNYNWLGMYDLMIYIRESALHREDFSGCVATVA